MRWIRVLLIVLALLVVLIGGAVVFIVLDLCVGMPELAELF